MTPCQQNKKVKRWRPGKNNMQTMPDNSGTFFGSYCSAPVFTRWLIKADGFFFLKYGSKKGTIELLLWYYRTMRFWYRDIHMAHHWRCSGVHLRSPVTMIHHHTRCGQKEKTFTRAAALWFLYMSSTQTGTLTVKCSLILELISLIGGLIWITGHVYHFIPSIAVH